MMEAATDLATEWSARLESLPVPARLGTLQEAFGSRLVASTSFGLQSAVMLDLLARHAPEVPVVFIDTGYLFPETYRYAETLVERFGTDLRVYQPQLSAARLEALHGRLWERGGEGLDKYALITKVEPMNRALTELGAEVWMSGVRRCQSTTRHRRTFAEHQRRTLKVYPILDWADAQVAAYMHEHDLPPHPLAAEGYMTMGDWHSTRPAGPQGSAEGTRFDGERYECGLHLESLNHDFQI